MWLQHWRSFIKSNQYSLKNYQCHLKMSSLRHLRRMGMFHKALWMWNWKRGKYAALLFFFSTLYFLSFGYYKAAEINSLSNYYEFQKMGEKKFYYHYSFSSYRYSFWLGILTIALACILIGWERSNQ